MYYSHLKDGCCINEIKRVSLHPKKTTRRKYWLEHDVVGTSIGCLITFSYVQTIPGVNLLTWYMLRKKI